jgi:hypothetical protein
MQHHDVDAEGLRRQRESILDLTSAEIQELH